MSVFRAAKFYETPPLQYVRLTELKEKNVKEEHGTDFFSASIKFICRTDVFDEMVIVVIWNKRFLKIAVFEIYKYVLHTF